MSRSRNPRSSLSAVRSISSPGQQEQFRANIVAAQAARQSARLRQSYTRIIAPFDGVVGQRSVHPGDYVNVGTNLIAVIPVPRVFIIANYKGRSWRALRRASSSISRWTRFPAGI